MKKEYCRPETWLVVLMSPYTLLNGSKTMQGGGGNHDGEWDNQWGARDGFWEDIDEDLLEDFSQEEINELD